MHFFLKELNDRFEERRRENAASRRIRHSQFDVSVLQSKKAYADMFEEYEWFPLDGYILHVAGPDVLAEHNTMEKKVQFITEICKQEIVYDKGVAGVSQRVHSDGRKRIRLGTQTSVQTKQDHNFGFCFFGWILSHVVSIRFLRQQKHLIGKVRFSSFNYTILCIETK